MDISNNFSEPFDYKALETLIKEIKERFPFAQVFSIGKSWDGRELFCIKLGSGKNSCLYVGAHHALEWCTSQILMRFVLDYCSKKENSESIMGYRVDQVFEKCTVYIIPMLNPDGVELVINGITENNPYYERAIKINEGKTVFDDWQANIRGVDLNHNYYAGWGEGKMKERELNIFFEGPTRYGGDYPESEKETVALCGFVRSVKPDSVIAFHSQGEEIYYEFKGKIPPKGEALAKIFSDFTGYQLIIPDGITAVGGFKDWFIEEFEQPGFTIEAGFGKNPLSASQTEKAYSDLKKLLIAAPLFVGK